MPDDESFSERRDRKLGLGRNKLHYPFVYDVAATDIHWDLETMRITAETLFVGTAIVDGVLLLVLTTSTVRGDLSCSLRGFFKF